MGCNSLSKNECNNTNYNNNINDSMNQDNTTGIIEKTVSIPGCITR